MEYWNLSKLFYEGGKNENNGWNKPYKGIMYKGILYTYMEMSQWNPLYNYYILTKMFKCLVLFNNLYAYFFQ
jgi:hypothetical protein